MARIAAGDRLERIPNHFELVLAAAYRVRQLVQDHTPKVNVKDEPTVIVLRETTSGQVGVEMLKRAPF